MTRPASGAANALPEPVRRWLEANFSGNPVAQNLLRNDQRLTSGRVWEYLRKASEEMRSVDQPLGVATPIADVTGYTALTTLLNGEIEYGDPAASPLKDDPGARLAEFLQFCIHELSDYRVTIPNGRKTRWIAEWRAAAAQCRVALEGKMPFPGLSADERKALATVADYFDQQADSYEKHITGRYFRPDDNDDDAVRGRIATISDRLLAQSGKRLDGIITTLVSVGLDIELSKETVRNRRRSSRK